MFTFILKAHDEGELVFDRDYLVTTEHPINLETLEEDILYYVNDFLRMKGLPKRNDLELDLLDSAQLYKDYLSYCIHMQTAVISIEVVPYAMYDVKLFYSDKDKYEAD